MSPYEISIMLHYYAMTDDHEAIHRGGQLWGTTISWMKEEGLLEDDDTEMDRTYRLTAKGDFYVKEGLCAVPLPRSLFVIPDKAKP